MDIVFGIGSVSLSLFSEATSIAIFIARDALQLSMTLFGSVVELMSIYAEHLPKLFFGAIALMILSHFLGFAFHILHLGTYPLTFILHMITKFWFIVPAWFGMIFFFKIVNKIHCVFPIMKPYIFVPIILATTAFYLKYIGSDVIFTYFMIIACSWPIVHNGLRKHFPNNSKFWSVVCRNDSGKALYDVFMKD